MRYFLIAHKVRGEEAFDIAVQLQIGSDLGWIIPTSGHRAYPYWTTLITGDILGGKPDMPLEWPDHYQAAQPPRAAVRQSNATQQTTIEDLLI